MTITIVVPEREGGSVADINAAVETCEEAAALVTPILDYTADIEALAPLTTELAALGPIADDIVTVSGIAADVTAVAADATDIGTVATNIANVNTVAGISGNVTTVAGISANVTSVAGNATNINTVAGISANVTTVAGVSASVTTVAGISANVTTVAGISANVTTVAGISADVAIVAPIAADVTAVAADATDIGTVATNIANVNALGPIASDISGVNAISADVTTCATNIADIQDAASLVTGLPLLAEQARYVKQLAEAELNLPLALCPIFVGQSGQVPQGSASVTFGLPSYAKMPVDGHSSSFWRHFDNNAENAPHWDSVNPASVVAFEEGVGYVSGAAQPGEGCAAGFGFAAMGTGLFSAYYPITAAIGSRTIDTLSRGGPRNQLYAGMESAAAMARADGFRPVFVFMFHQGESDSNAGTAEATYKTALKAYWAQLRYYASIIMEKPDYVAPIVCLQITNYRFGSGTAATGRGILRATREAADEVPGVYLDDPSYNLLHEASGARTHLQPSGMVNRGIRAAWRAVPAVARALGFAYPGYPEPLRVVDAYVRSTDTDRVYIVWNRPCWVDTTYDFGTNATVFPNSLHGLGYNNDGTLITPTSTNAPTTQATASPSWYIDLTSAPSGTGTQQLYVGTLDMGTTNSTDTSRLPGTRIHTGDDGVYSPFVPDSPDTVQLHHAFALLDTVTVRFV